MKLKSNVTVQQLEDLGFVRDFENADYLSIYDSSCEIGLCIDTNRLIGVDRVYDEIGEYVWYVPDILLKMFQLGYIEESEEA